MSKRRGVGGGGSSKNQTTNQLPIPKEKVLDAFQSQLSYLLVAQKTVTPKISLWPQHAPPDYAGKPRFSKFEIYTLLKKGSPSRDEQSIPQEAMALQTPGRETGNDDRARPFQGAAGALRVLSLTQRSPPRLWPKSGSDGGGPPVGLPNWAFPGRGRGKTRRWRLSVRPPAAATDPGPLPPRPTTLCQPERPSPGRSSGSSSKMRPPTPPAPSALSPTATDTVAVPRLLAPEMWSYDPEPWTQSRFRLPLRLPPEPQPQPRRRRRRRRRLPFRPPSSHGPAARRQPNHVTEHWPRPRLTARSDALPGDAGARQIPSLGLWLLLPSAASQTGTWQRLGSN